MVGEEFAYNAAVARSLFPLVSCLVALGLGGCADDSGSADDATGTGTGLVTGTSSMTSAGSGATPTTTDSPMTSTVGADSMTDDETGSVTTSQPADSSDSGSTGNGERDFGPERDEFFGDSRCADADVLLCDGFEDGEIDESVWEIVASGGGSVELVTDESARGGQSVHIRANNGRGFLRNSSVFPVNGDRYWGRMFIRVDRFSTEAWAHWTIAEASGEGDGSLIRVGGQYNTNQGENHWGVGSDGGPTGDWTTHDQDRSSDPPEDTWICVEWLHDGATDEAQVFIDAVEHPSLATTSDTHGGNDVAYDLPGFTSVWFGWWQYQSDPTAFDVWIDEIAIDTERMGCKL